MKKVLNIEGLFLIFLLFNLVISCKKDKPTPPSITTTAVTEISAVTAKSGGNITSDNGGTVNSRGVCWGTSENPTVNGNKTTDGNGAGTFTSSLSGLTPATVYYVRAYATNAAGTAYGDQQSFQTDPATVTDIEGNNYNVVRIGTQLWMKENLKTTKFTDGTSITLVNSEFGWSSLKVSSKAYCWLNDNSDNKNIYGALYTWAAAQAVCPTGWHLPSDTEWATLISYSGGKDIAADKLKESGTAHWVSPNTATNETGFTALPGGIRDNIGNFFGPGKFAYWWSSTDVDAGNAWCEYVTYSSGDFSKGTMYKYMGSSVRCLKDN